MRVLALLFVLAVPAFGQVTTDCREVYPGRVRCNSTDNRIRIPPFVRAGEHTQRGIDGYRQAMETRALIDQMRSQTQMNNAITNQLNQRPQFVPEPGQKTAAELSTFLKEAPQMQAAPAKSMDFPEILDYARQLLVKHKAGELSAEMLKGLVNVKVHAWLQVLEAQGLTPIEVDKFVALAKSELAPIKKELK